MFVCLVLLQALLGIAGAFAAIFWSIKQLALRAGASFGPWAGPLTWAGAVILLVRLGVSVDSVGGGISRVRLNDKPIFSHVRAPLQAVGFVLRNGGIVDEDGYDNAVREDEQRKQQQHAATTASNN